MSVVNLSDESINKIADLVHAKIKNDPEMLMAWVGNLRVAAAV